MANFSLKNFILGGKTFCCCLPVRFGVIAMSFLSIILSGTFSVTLWFEVSSAVGLSAQERGIFVGAGLVETFLLAASIFGFVGAIVRKQLFVMIYSYFLYAHFVINVIVATIFLWIITHTEQTDIVEACRGAIQNQQAQAQCTGLLHITEGVFIGVSTFVLLIELYCAIIVTRYVNQLRSEKGQLRASRSVARDSGFKLHSIKNVYSPIQGSDEIGMADYAPPRQSAEFDPYEHNYSGLHNDSADASYDHSKVHDRTVEASGRVDIKDSVV